MTSASIKKARSLRANPTDAENRLWQKIRGGQLGCKIRRQVPVGVYTTDFLCLELKLVIEVDGSQHADNEKDKARTAFLNSLGYEVIRFWNNEVMENLDGVLETLQTVIKERAALCCIDKVPSS